jgi:hypothetical protein
MIDRPHHLVANNKDQHSILTVLLRLRAKGDIILVHNNAHFLHHADLKA